jgi:hypothetical protein
MAGLFNPTEIYNMLRQQGLLPRLIDANPYGQRGAGLFSESKNVVVARDPSKAGFPSIQENRTDTLAHELTHAAQFNLLYPALKTINSKVTAKEKLTTQEVQFSEAMDKLMSENPSLKAMLGKMYTSEGIRADDKYRTSLPELQAWGVGYMSRPTNSMNKEKDNINPHLNPSMATEFSILSDLYSRLPDNVKAVSSRLKQDEIKSNRKSDREGMVRDSVDIFDDPFKSTIR